MWHAHHLTKHKKSETIDIEKKNFRDGTFLLNLSTKWISAALKNYMSFFCMGRRGCLLKMKQSDRSVPVWCLWEAPGPSVDRSGHGLVCQGGLGKRWTLVLHVDLLPGGRQESSLSTVRWVSVAIPPSAEAGHGASGLLFSTWCIPRSRSPLSPLLTFQRALDLSRRWSSPGPRCLPAWLL